MIIPLCQVGKKLGETRTPNMKEKKEKKRKKETKEKTQGGTKFTVRPVTNHSLSSSFTL